METEYHAGVVAALIGNRRVESEFLASKLPAEVTRLRLSALHFYALFIAFRCPGDCPGYALPAGIS